MPRYIDADALKDVIQQHEYPLADRLNSIDNGMFTLGIFQAIDEQPTISPDDVRGVGEWIKYAPHNSDMLVCSVCEKYWILDGDQYDFRYCPNCGAAMLKGE